MKKLILKLRSIPVSMYLLMVACLTWIMGTLVTKMSELQSDFMNLGKEEFIRTIVTISCIWIVTETIRYAVNRISKIVITDKAFMKWITKLSYSKLSSINSIGTGGITNAIYMISNSYKDIMFLTVGTLPFILPFYALCIKEYNTAGYVPVLVNIVDMLLIIGTSFLMSKMKSVKRQTEGNLKIKAVSMDCIKSSRTVKYFQKEDWSIDRQGNTQKEVFQSIINLPFCFSRVLYLALRFIPMVLNTILCWDNMNTVLFIFLTDYTIENIADSISAGFELYADYSNNMKALGELKPDESKKPMPNKLNINNVEFRYSKDSKVIFMINDLTIEKGKRYCVTGKSGFGKSTLIKLLTNTVSPTIGEIPQVNTVYMFAESEMFNTSVFENIALGDSTVDEAEVIDILNHLEVELDMSVFDSVGENGCNLSTGQIQRVNLARTIVYARRHPSVLVALDEVTSALDEETSKSCINYLASEFKRLGTTLLYVSNKNDYIDSDLITDNIYVEKRSISNCDCNTLIKYKQD